jgi:hypothetical protein
MTEPVTIKGREMEMKFPTPLQMTLLGRELSVLQRAQNNPEIVADNAIKYFASIARVLDIMEALIVKEADRDFLTEKMRDGDLSLDELKPLFTSVLAGDPESAPVVRRARVKRS